MNAKKTILILTFALFTASSLYAGQCHGDNCKATITKKDNTPKTSTWSVKNKKNSTKIYYVDNVTSEVSEDYINSMIPLDDNEESLSTQDEIETIQDKTDIVLTYAYSNDNFQKTFPACEDIENNIIACDDNKLNKECECV